MHQHPRPTPRSASSPSDPQNNPTRTNNPRDEPRLAVRPAQSVSSDSESGRSGLSDAARQDDPANAEKQRLNLIIQHFFAKAALIIVASRVNLPIAQTKDGDARLEKWFNTWLRDTNVLGQDLSDWRTMDATQAIPPTLTIDFYLDLAQHTHHHSLVSIDEEERRWDVAKSVESYAASQGLPAPSTLVYERWTVSLEGPSIQSPAQSSDAPPNIYKKGVVLLRSLYTYARFLPAWKFFTRIARYAGNGSHPKPKFTISKGPVRGTADTLSWPLSKSSAPIVEDYHFNPLPCAFGSLKISVAYRTNCTFELDPVERVVSAQSATGTGSASGESSGRAIDSTSDDFAPGPRHRLPSRVPSAEGRDDGTGRPGSDGGRPVSASKSSLRSDFAPGSMPRRTSVSFQPFKAGSLSSSPAGGAFLSGSPGGSSAPVRQVGATPAMHSRSRSSLNTLPQQALRTPALSNEQAIASSASSSPKPAPIQRYSSSFSNRRARFPSGSATSKPEEDGTSSRGSVASGQRVSVSFAEPESGVPDDSESIGDFLKMLDTSSRRLPSFTRTDPASLAANSQRTVAQYSKFAKMRDSTVQLSDSMSSSLMLQRSSTSSSRQISNVPGLVGGQPASLSTSSSPGGKPVSPHTPHTPAVPSRLSNASVASYSRTETDSSSRTVRGGSTGQSRSSTTTTPSRSDHVRAIDIPNSPRAGPIERRSSSVRNDARVGSRFVPTGAVDDDLMPFGLRSASLPSEENSIAMRQRPGGMMGRGGVGGSSINAAIDRHDDEEEEEEPLLFDLGELGRESLRRLE